MHLKEIDVNLPTPAFIRATLQDFRFWIGIIAFVTLIPQSGPAPRFTPCWICGDRGVSDAIVNLILFLPLGLSLSLRKPDRARYRVPILLSFIVETAQHFIPGRSPTYGDLLFNSLGGWLGIWLGTHSYLWWVASERIARRWLIL
jgi:hypothetical protein